MKLTLSASALTLLAAFAPASEATTYTFSTIDPQQPYYTDIAFSINDAGAIAGEWDDSSRMSHGFTFTNGVFSSFDAPGVDGSKNYGWGGTQFAHLDNAGNIVGTYIAQGLSHGFVRDTGGNFTTVDLAGHLNTQALGINDSGAIAVRFYDGVNLNEGSGIRNPDGTLTTIAFPGTLLTQVTAINNAGVTVGAYTDAANVVHGWIRSANGTFNSLDDARYDLVAPWGLNNSGWAVGELDVPGGAHGFVRDPLGKLSSFDVPGATYTTAFAMNSQGLIVGQYCDANENCHGFLATPAVPEPGTLALWAAGVGVVGWRARHSRAQ
jgi:hypothetical protein